MASVSNSQPGEDSSRLRRWRLYRRPSREAPEARRLLGSRRRSEVPRHSETEADDFVIGDLRDPHFCRQVVDRRFDEVYQLAADMGGAGYIFTGEHDADIMHNSATINLNMLDACRTSATSTRIFYSSSACMYPAYNQEDPDNPNCAEDQRLSGGARQRIRLGEAVQRAALPRLQPQPRHAQPRRPLPQHLRPRGHLGRRQGKGAGRDLPQGRHGARTAATIEIWGDGLQTRSFLYIDECLEGTIRLTRSDFEGPVNIGSEEMVTINQLVDIVADIAGKTHPHEAHSRPDSACAGATPTTA